MRPDAEAVGATQFETLTAAALAAFAERGVDAAVVEAGLGGRLDATNVLAARVVHLTNVGLEHTDVLGETREQIAREKLAVVAPGHIVVLGDPEWSRLVPDSPIKIGGAREAAEAFLDRPVTGEVEVQVPGRLDWRSPDELWDGAHTPEGAEWLLDRPPWPCLGGRLLGAAGQTRRRATRAFRACQRHLGGNALLQSACAQGR